MRKIPAVIWVLALLGSCGSNEISEEKLQDIFAAELVNLDKISSIEELKHEQAQVESVLESLKKQHSVHESDFAYLNQLYKMQIIH